MPPRRGCPRPSLADPQRRCGLLFAKAPRCRHAAVALDLRLPIPNADVDSPLRQGHCRAAAISASTSSPMPPWVPLTLPPPPTRGLCLVLGFLHLHVAAVQRGCGLTLHAIHIRTNLRRALRAEQAERQA